MSIVNISLLLDMAADGFGDRVLAGRRSAGLTAERVRRLSVGGARQIRDAGADSVVYFGVNGPAFPVALFAAARAGVPLVPVNYRLGADQLGPLLANHPRALGLAGPGEIGALRAAGLTALTFDDWLGVIGPLAGLPVHRRPGRRHDHPGRREHSAGRDRGDPAGPPRGRRRGRRRRPRRRVGPAHRGGGCVARYRDGGPRRTARARQNPDAGLQDTRPHRGVDRDPTDRDRQAHPPQRSPAAARALTGGAKPALVTPECLLPALGRRGPRRRPWRAATRPGSPGGS